MAKPKQPEPQTHKNVFVRVSVDLAARIEAAAAADSRSVSAWIRLALERQLKEGK